MSGHDLQALGLKAYIQRKLGQDDSNTINLAQNVDPRDYWTAIEATMDNNTTERFIQAQKNKRNEGIIAVQEVLEVANNYLSVKDHDDAITLLNAAIDAGEAYSSYPLAQYYIAYCQSQKGERDAAIKTLEKSNKLSPVNNFPMRIEEVNMFDTLTQIDPNCAMAYYYQGCLLRYLGQIDEAVAAWEKSFELNPNLDITARNIGYTYGKDFLDFQKSKQWYDKAVAINPNDAFLLNESDIAYEKARIPAADRLKRLEKHRKTVEMHDDAVMTLLYLYNENKQYDKALKHMDKRHF